MSGAPLRSRAAGPATHARERPARPRVLERRLSILHLITRLERGGSADCTLLQAMGSARRGHDVTLACGPTDLPSPLVETAARQAGVRLVAIPDLVRSLAPLKDARAFAAILRLLRSHRFDVVHTHTSKAGALGRLAAAIGSKAPVIHQPHGHLFYGYHGRVGSRLVILAERLMAPLARRQIVLSWRGAEEHLARGVGRPDQFTVIRSGIDLRPFRRAGARRAACRARLGLGPDDFVVGTLCRLETIKGVEDLLAGFLVAARKRPGLRLLLGGDGPLRERLMETARQSGAIGQVLVAGAWVDPRDVLPGLDLFALVSRNEGMGRALVEAMLERLPIVATNVGGIPEVLEEGRAGLLVPPGDPEAIADAIVRLMDDRSLGREMSRRARARAVTFGAGRMNRALLRLYREVLR